MTQIDRVYAWLLRVGFIVLRQAIDSGEQDWVRAELEWLHNVPSLIGETNVLRHEYFWNEERRSYIDWISSSGSRAAVSRMKTYYEPLLQQLEPLIMQILLDPEKTETE